LRYYHVRQADGDVYFFFNEHPHQEIDTFVELPINGPLFYYDAYQNKTYSIKESNKLLGKWKIPITLSPFETIAVVSGVIDQQYVGSVKIKDEEVIEEIEVCEEWKVSIATSQQYPNFEAYTTLDSLVDLSRPNYLPRFAGTFRYETEIDFKSSKDKVWLDLGEVYETAEVIVNGVSAGVRISYPYHFEISNLLEDSKNTLTIEVTNTLVKEQRDFFSNVAQQEASGLLGPVRLLVKE